MDLDEKKKLSLDFIKDFSVKYINFILVGIIVALALFYLNKEFVIAKAHTLSSNVSSAQKQVASLSAKKISVDLEGEIVNPGIYELEEGKRVNDAIVLAGGFTKDVDIKYVVANINKAQKLTDGMKIYIPSIVDNNNPAAVSGSAPSAPTAQKLININTATKDELDTLEGVGSVTAEKIINGRPYTDIKELVSKDILKESQFQKIKDLISS